MSEIIIALIGIVSIIVSSVASFVLAKKAGIGPFQDTIVNSLKNVVFSQGEEIKTLTAGKLTQEQRIKELEEKVIELQGKIEQLEELTVAQALLIQQLTPKSRRKPVSLDE